MMRSLWAGVSGLQNHQTRMDVLGNNISNVNTNGFKKGRVTFQDMLSQTLAGAAKPTDEVGGVNPQQVGLGMMVATIDTIHTQGALQSTGVMTDVAIQGNGFFVLKSGDKRFYTRNGAFGLDQDGRLVNPTNGLRVQGWMAQTAGGQAFINNAAEVEDLVIPVGSKDPAKATHARDPRGRDRPDYPGRHLADDIRRVRFFRPGPQAAGKLHQDARSRQQVAGRRIGGSRGSSGDKYESADRQGRQCRQYLPA
jgi:flagellar hook-basal body protein